MHTYIITSIQSTKQPPSVLSFADVGQPIETPSPLKTNREREREVKWTEITCSNIQQLITLLWVINTL